MNFITPEKVVPEFDTHTNQFTCFLILDDDNGFVRVSKITPLWDLYGHKLKGFFYSKDEAIKPTYSELKLENDRLMGALKATNKQLRELIERFEAK